MSTELNASARRVQDALKSRGVNCEVVELPESTRTAEEAATAIGCRKEHIAKSIVFKKKNSQSPVLVIASGVNRVSEKRLASWVGEPVVKGDAAFGSSKGDATQIAN